MKNLFYIFIFISTLYADISYSKIQEYSNAKKEHLYKRGEKIHKIVCKDIDLKSFSSFDNMVLKIRQKNLCGEINEKNLEAVSLYLWDIKRLDKKEIKTQKISIPSDTKCPVCGMYVHKYPKWSTMMVLQNHTHYFDGVKDMMKFYFYPDSFGHKDKTSEIKNMYVSDYYTFEMIDAKEAWYVEGSNVYGPMGNELIPFKTKENAKVFMKNHYGKKLLNFEMITKKIIFALDK